jgi:hypothetical protein
MKNYRVCVAEDGKLLSVHLRQEREVVVETHWLTSPDRERYPETSKETEYVHYLNAVDELSAYLKAQTMEKEGR